MGFFQGDKRWKLGDLGIKKAAFEESSLLIV